MTAEAVVSGKDLDKSGPFEDNFIFYDTNVWDNIAATLQNH